MTEPRAARGRPRTFNHDELLDRSVEVFWQHGLAGTTTRVLERELEISQSSLYNSYGSKEALLDQAVDRYESKLNTAVLDRLTPPSRAALLAFIDAVLAWVANDRHRGCLILNLATEDREQGFRLKAYRRRLRRSLKPAVRSFTDDEELVEARTELLVASVLGLNTCATTGAGNVELKRMGRSLKRQVADW